MHSSNRAWPATAVRPSAGHPHPATLPVHPAFRQAPPPVVVVGMHRSGTSLVAGLLLQLGVYLGPDARLPAFAPESESVDAELVRSGYGETLPFRLVNDAVLRLGRSAWDAPGPFLAAREQPDLARRAVRSMAAATGTSVLRVFREGMPPGAPWGWKDPRTSLTLPFWLSLFPQARVIHVRRDPEAAARSLHQRALAWRAQAVGAGPLPPLQRAAWWVRHPVQTLRRAGRRWGLLRDQGEIDPCTSLDHCRLLAADYGAALRAGLAGAESVSELEYEALLADPVAQVRRLAACLDLRPAPDQVLQAAMLVRR
jgi:hypothetical protein